MLSDIVINPGRPALWQRRADSSMISTAQSDPAANRNWKGSWDLVHYKSGRPRPATPKTPKAEASARSARSSAYHRGVVACGTWTPSRVTAGVLAQTGVASRREVEEMITAGRISVNGDRNDRAKIGPLDGCG